MRIEVNDIVGRKSYECDVLFRIIDIRVTQGKQEAILYGEDIRLVADAPFQDLLVINDEERSSRQKTNNALQEQSFLLFSQDKELLKQKSEYQSSNGYRYRGDYFQIPGRVLHIDGDPSYLRKCLDVYEKIGIPVKGIYCNEKEMPERIGTLIDDYRPDILVITGHDSYSKSKGKKKDLHAYRHSMHFAQTVLEARKKIPSLDQLIIFAGACQSHFESLIQAGANFASSPERVNIHALDPVYIVAKISFTSFREYIHVWDVLRNTLTGEKGLGGIDTKGVLRTGLPYHISKEE
ncbi:sporulation peptidase YabG [Peribacillus cavernae]|uniref:Sporulation peptidase YabG n=1 Tax=Peribacillus cavernae TaxID=1674310 RepID=A0A433HFZ8_9BACI|nr:sporulation peptidase YabG [Peribacillus cavernae]MDQ0220908.1 spore coat assembly protein [Peribacillus cavernae]RUQ27277.1 sporulation peptidase YabG [Peribacillus cavernae]